MTSSSAPAHLSVGEGSPAGGTVERPLSFYDNLSTNSSSTLSGPGRIIQFPDIQFRFDENIPDRRSVHSTAKSDFFGLSVAAPPLASQANDESGPGTISPANTPTPPPPPPPHNAASPSSPTSSGASTVPVHRSPSGSPASAGQGGEPATTSTPRCSRPNSTIKTITIKLPDPVTGSGGGPSEAVYMTTTVPQNFAKNANTLIGRHKPTRSSLRHSRMLVINKTVPVRYPPGNSLNLRHLRLCRTLMVLEILIGIVLNVIGLAIMVWSPSTSTKDNPYWSGLILIVCGVLFLVLFQFKRARSGTDKGAGPGVTARLHQPQSPWRENCFHFLRVNALIVLLLTIFFTALAFIYALIHATNLSAEGLRCEPQFTSSTCVCTIDTRPTLRVSPAVNGTNSTLVDGGSTEPSVPLTGATYSGEGVIRLEYRDFNCNEVHSIWYYVMIVSTLLNSAGCLLATTFLVIYSIECLRRSSGNDRQPTHRAKNGQPANASDTAGAHQPQTTTPDASQLPLLTVAKPAARSPADASILSSDSSGRQDAAGGDMTLEENTLTTILSEEVGGGEEEGSKMLVA